MLVIWCFIGLVFWIPLLFRVIISFGTSVVFNSILKKELNVEKHHKLLYLAYTFYYRGFKNINNGFQRSQNNHNSINPRKHTWIDYLWTLFFWGTLLISIQPNLFKYENINNTYKYIIQSYNEKFNQIKKPEEVEDNYLSDEEYKIWKDFSFETKNNYQHSNADKILDVKKFYDNKTDSIVENLRIEYENKIKNTIDSLKIEKSIEYGKLVYSDDIVISNSISSLSKYFGDRHTGQLRIKTSNCNRETIEVYVKGYHIGTIKNGENTIKYNLVESVTREMQAESKSGKYWEIEFDIKNQQVTQLTLECL